MPAATRAIYVEVQDAQLRPECGPAGPLTWKPTVVCLPSYDPTAQTSAAIAYASAKGIGRPGQPPLVIRIDVGATFADIGRRDVGNQPKGSAPVMVGLSTADAIRGYETGCLDYRRRVSFANGWTGCEFENVARVADLLSAAGLVNVIVYLDALGEFTLDPWSMDASPEIMATLQGLAISARAGARGFPRQILPGARNWTDWYPPSRTVISTTALRMLADAGFRGRFFVNNTGNAGRPIVREDGKVQPPTPLAAEQLSSFGWYYSGDEATAACVACLAEHRARGIDYWPHFSLQTDPIEMAARVRYGGGDHCTVWGDPTDLPKLAPLAAAVAAWSS